MGGDFTFHTCLTLAFSRLKNAEKLCFFCSLEPSKYLDIMKKLNLVIVSTWIFAEQQNFLVIQGGKLSQEMKIHKNKRYKSIKRFLEMCFVLSHLSAFHYTRSQASFLNYIKMTSYLFLCNEKYLSVPLHHNTEQSIVSLAAVFFLCHATLAQKNFWGSVA